MTKKAMLLSFLGGFLSLSVEVLYIRIFSFSALSIPQAFSLTLAIFLIGIALGSFIGKGICQKGRASINTIGKLFLLAGICDLLAIFSVISSSYNHIALLLVCILICASVRGIVFPIVHHLGTEKVKSGAAISNVYFANVLGCTIAPVLIGFYLLDIFSTQQTYFSVIVVTFVIAVFCVDHKGLKFSAGLVSLAVLSGIFMMPEKLITTLATRPSMELETLIENKHGFIQVYQDDKKEHAVFGNNVYDGKLNVDLINNSNMIDRAYLVPVIAPDLKNILVIGLSTGSWVEVLTAMPNLEKITVVELNPAYTKFAQFYPEMEKLLQDPRVEIIADDGRRWLNRHKESKFDFILMNTTWHWRNYSSNLLSREFLTLAKSHLNNNGFLLYNTTEALDAYYTAKQVFPYVYQYKNMALASLKSILSFSKEQVYQRFKNMKWRNGELIFPTEEKLNIGIKRMFEAPFVGYEKINFSKLNRPLEVITDKNMITEYKYGFLSQKGH
ncbi:Spermidine synthase [Phocoenobacter uteri]|uniref:Spermidine synthase n=1 Tax=Phocoenobacter uteri TaxID=146806 RepID=A0A379CBZ2_9PAST|nr:fused MFS/spermidine synthase [Phocoenobacter uteri]MDG6881214.1 hypothetical protein [Phocoenobacter uteri]SUB59236.1 Spermidine synthase [Phocoenobacter uteri]